MRGPLPKGPQHYNKDLLVFALTTLGLALGIMLGAWIGGR